MSDILDKIALTDYRTMEKRRLIEIIHAFLHDKNDLSKENEELKQAVRELAICLRESVEEIRAECGAGCHREQKALNNPTIKRIMQEGGGDA